MLKVNICCHKSIIMKPFCMKKSCILLRFHSYFILCTFNCVSKIAFLKCEWIFTLPLALHTCMQNNSNFMPECIFSAKRSIRSIFPNDLALLLVKLNSFNGNFSVLNMRCGRLMIKMTNYSLNIYHINARNQPTVLLN